MDIATLSLEVRSDKVKEANLELRAMPQAASAAERAAAKLVASTEAAGKSSEEFSRRVRRNIETLEFQAQQMVRSAAEQERYTALRRAGVAAESAAGQAITASIRTIQAQRQAQQELTEATRRAAAVAQQQAAGYAALAAQEQARSAAARKIVADLEFERAQLARTSTERAQYDAIRRAGVTAASAEGKAIMTTVAALEAERTALRQVAAARQTATGATSGAMTAQQRLMLGYQLNDIFTQMSMGTNPMMVAAQQGPQITQIFGGLKNTLARIPTPVLAAGGTALAALGGAAVLNGIAEMNDGLAEQQRRFMTLLGSQSAASAAYKDIAKSASETGTAVDVATASFVSFAHATKALGATQSGIQSISTTVEKLTQLAGANDNESNAAGGALADMLRQSTVGAEALRTVLANVPQIADQIAAGLGVSVTQLRLMTAEGDLTNKQVFDALLKRADAVNAEFNRMPKSVGSTFSSIATDLGQALKNMTDSVPLLQEYRNTLNAAADAAKRLRENSTPNPGATVNALWDTPALSGPSATTMAGRFAPDPLGRNNGSVGNAAVRQQIAAAQFDLGLQQNAKTWADLASAMRPAVENLEQAVLIGRQLDPVEEKLKELRKQSEIVQTAIANLLAGKIEGMSSEATVAYLEKMRETAQRLETQMRNTGSAADLAKQQLNIRADQMDRGLTPAQRDLEDRERDYRFQGESEARANALANAQQIQSALELVNALELEAKAEEAKTIAMRGGKQAMIDAAVAAAVLAWQLKNVAASSEEAEVAMDVIAERVANAFQTIETQKGLQGGTNASKQYLDELATIAAAMKVVEQGAYAMRRAEAEAKAARAEDGTGKLQMQVFDARQALTDASAVQGLREEIELTNKLAAAAGNVGRQKQIQLEYDIKRAQQNAGPGAAAVIGEEMRARAIAEQNRNLAEGVASLEQQILLVREEASVVGAGTAQYAAQVAMIQKRRDLIKDGADVEKDANAQRQIVLAGDLAAAKHQADEIRKTQELWMEPLRSGMQSIQQTAADAWEGILNSGKISFESLGAMFKKVLVRMAAEFLALATIRPVLNVIVNAVGGIASQIGGSVVGGGSSGGGLMGGLGSMLGGLGNMFGGSGGGSLGGMIGGLFGGGGGVTATAAPVGGYSAGLGANGLGTIGSASGLGATGSTFFNGASSFFNPSTGLQMGNFGLSNLGGALGVGMGAMSLLNGGTKTTAGTIGGIGQMVGGGLMMIPTPWTMAAGAVISLASSLLPGVLGGNEPPKVINQEYGQLAYGAKGFGTSGGAWGPDANARNLEGPLKAAGATIEGLFQLMGGVKDAGKVWGVAVESYSKKDGKGWDFSNQTSFLVGPNGEKRQWGMGSTDKDIGLQTAAAQVALQSILGGATGDISANMRQALERVAPTEGGVSLDTIKEVVVEITAFEAAIKTFGKTTTDAEQALKAVDDSFKTLFETADKYGLDKTALDAAKTAERSKIGADFIAGIDRQFMDPQTAALFDIGEERTSLLRNNSAMVGVIKDYQDQALRIEELYSRKRLAILEEVNASTLAAQRQAANDLVSAVTSSVGSIQELIRDLSPGGALANVDPRDQLSGLRATSGASYAQAMGDPTNSTLIDRAVNDARAFAEYSLRFNAGNTDYESDKRFVLAQQQALQVATAQQGAQVATDPETKRLLQQILTATQQPANNNAQRDADLTRLINLLMSYIANGKRAA